MNAYFLYLVFLVFPALIAGAVALVRHARRLERLERELGLLQLDRSRLSAPPIPEMPRPVPAALPMEIPLPSAPAPESIPRPVMPPPLPPGRPGGMPAQVLAQSAAPVLETSTGLAAPSAPPTPPAPSTVAPKLPAWDWEQFLGVKLFAWLGGFALFLSAAFFLKYSFEHDLIPPAARAAIGYVAALALIGGGLGLWKRRYETTAQTLVGTGVVILYAVTFACKAIYQFPFFGPWPTGVLMVLITVAAFLLAVRMEAQAVAILGLLGGFLTPVLIGSNVDNPVALFSYITLLDLGLFAVIWHRRWHHLTLLAAVATLAIQMGWWGRFYEADKLVVLQVVQPWFVALFTGFFLGSEGTQRSNRWITTSVLLVGAVTLLSGLGLAASGSGEQPVRLFTLWLAVDALLLWAALQAPRLRWVEPGAGAAVFVLLAVWTVARARAEFLYPALGAYFAYALLHTAVPLVRLRLRPSEGPGLWSQLFPALTLALFVLPLLKDTGALPAVYWLAVLAVDLLAFVLAVLTGALLAVIGVLVLTLCVAAIAIGGSGVAAMGGNESLAVIAGFAVLFVAGGWWLSRKGNRPAVALPEWLQGMAWNGDPRLPVCGSGAILPFLLLTLLASRTPDLGSGALFGMTALLTVLTLGLARATGFHILSALGLVGAALVQWTWHGHRIDAAQAGATIAWHLAFYAAFTLFPFVIARQSIGRRSAWITGAVAGPVHFLLVYVTVKQAWPELPVPGLIPAAFAVPALAGLAWLARRWAGEVPHRLTVLSCQGAAALLLITLIFPIQFDRQWLTVAWALEGAALLWLFQRLPHPGLRYTGLALLAVAFARLTLNPYVLEYHERTGTRIWNWYLYAYPVATAAFFAGARLSRPPAHSVLGKDVRPVLRGLGTVLLFVLMNLEIADYFATGATLTFNFSGNLARDLSYTIGWSLFALALVVAGIVSSSRLTRYAGLGLLGITLLKLFFHDLARLNQLYRIAAFAGVAVVAILASFLYQRFLNRPDPTHEVAPT